MIFERIAPRYDLANTVLSLGLHRRWKQALIRVLRLTEEDLVLDAGTGTGDLAVLAASTGARVIGVDKSAAMLGIAGRKLAQTHPAAGNTARSTMLIGGDLSQLPLADGAVTAVMTRMGQSNSFRDELAPAERPSRRRRWTARPRS